MRIRYSPLFIRQYKKLPEELKEEVILKVEIFKKDSKKEVLKIHKLHGKFKEFHAFSVNYYIRIIFKKEKQMIIFTEIGNHDLYK